MVIFLFFVSTLFLIHFVKAWRGYPGFTFFGIVALYVICISWVPYYVLCNYFLQVGWDYPLSGLEFFCIVATFVVSVQIAMVAKRLLYWRPLMQRVDLLSRFANSLKGRVYFWSGSVVVASCIGGLAMTKGITLSVGNYGTRFESNTDTGGFTILSYTAVSIAVLWFLKRPTWQRMIVSVGAMFAYGIFLFMTLGGARNYLVAAVLPVLLIAYALKVVKEKQLVIFFLAGVGAITALAMVRYGNAFGAGSARLIATYTRDTVFPVESLSRIFNNDQIRFVGFEYFFNQAYAAIPRMFWSGKPIYLDTIAYYFTEQIYGYGKGLVIAPTGIGSLYLMGGWLFVFLGVPLLISLFVLIDRAMFNGKSIFFICLWPSIFFSFFCFRESIELGLYKIIVHAVGTGLIYGLAMAIFIVLPKSRSHQRA
ncbi:WzyE family oligosaccharide polymerase [Paraburkholderia fungorum]|uniref:WzyE family oligosaccharide polymerase n=1 Tax=Paraburkholderia fungorum TaxID=134537 RepID=UPI001C1ED1BE|nr:WzyE family oligosaccharide polymerase [Paraburkholderia fungorum]MBU7442001.1 WzyE family oligosaccharide polymerase [Paraburkholderia fungorum]